MDPYRGGQLIELWCPRCKTKKLPPVEIATCQACHGVWVSAFASSVVLAENERRRSHVSWWRIREGCPLCDERMQMFGDEAIYQGCEDHGYFIDADVVPHMTLAKGIDHAAIEKKRAEWPSVPLDPELMRLAQLPYGEARTRERVALQKARAPAPPEPHAALFAKRTRIQELAADEERLFEVMTPVLGEELADALLERIRIVQRENASLVMRIELLEARVRYL